MKTDIDRLMQEENIDALWVTGVMMNNPNMVYFTGIHNASNINLFKLRNKPPIVFHDNLERDEAAKSGLKTQSYDDKFPFNKYLKEARGNVRKAYSTWFKDIFIEMGITSNRVAIFGIKDISNTYAIIEALKRELPQVEFIGYFKDSLLKQARMTKSQAEVEQIHQMGKITTQTVAKVADFLSSQKVKDNKLVNKGGYPITVKEIKKLIRLWLVELGADNPEGTIFAIGHDAGVPHSAGNPDYFLELGKPIVFDIFPCEAGGGYFYDFTRTWCLGYAPDEVQKLHAQVLQVHHQIISELRPNRPFRDFQKRTSELFTEMGHVTIEKQFNATEGYVHSIGHGLGLNVHENPFSGISAGERDILTPGMVFTIEPGLYYPSKNMGVRIEDTIYLNPQGKFEILADYPYNLLIPVNN